MLVTAQVDCSVATSEVSPWPAIESNVTGCSACPWGQIHMPGRQKSHSECLAFLLTGSTRRARVRGPRCYIPSADSSGGYGAAGWVLTRLTKSDGSRHADHARRT